MSLLSGIGFGQYHHRHGAATAVAGLGLVTRGNTMQVTKQTRGVVADFVRGETSEGSCSKKTSTCAVQSTGMSLTVDGEVLASRNSPSTNIIKVCIPTRINRDPPDKNGKSKVSQKSRDTVAAASTLMRILGTGIGSKTIRGDARILSSGSMRKNAARVLVPGQCVEVQLTPEMVETATVMQIATGKAQAAAPAGKKATRKDVSKAAKELRKERLKAKEDVLQQKRLAALAKARAARSAAAQAKAQAAAAAAAGKPAAAAQAQAQAAQATAVANQAQAQATQAASAQKQVRKQKKAAAPKAPAKKAAAPKKGGKKGRKK